MLWEGPELLKTLSVSSGVLASRTLVLKSPGRGWRKGDKDRREKGGEGAGKRRWGRGLQQQVSQSWPRAKARQVAGGAGVADKSFTLASGLNFNWFNICTVRSHSSLTCM